MNSRINERMYGRKEKCGWNDVEVEITDGMGGRVYTGEYQDDE